MAKFGIGQGMKRKEDQRFLTGTGLYTDDIAVEGAVRAVVVRSPMAHARIGGQAPYAIARLVLSDQPDQGGLPAQGDNIARHVGGATQAVFAARHAHHRHRRLGRNALDFAEPIAVQHDIAHDQNAHAGNRSNRKRTHCNSSKRLGA